MVFFSTAQADICAGRGTRLLVILKDSRLYLCDQSQSKGIYNIASGWGGIDKRQEGDRKTPIGTYQVGQPRPSTSGFHLFIEIGYPTLEQKKQGSTGSNVGLHGPHDYFRFLGPLNTWINWTDGCIAVGSREEIEEIANWVKSHPKALIEIE